MLEFLEGEPTPEVTAPAPEANEAQEQPAPEGKPEGPVRGPDGKFAAKDAQPVEPAPQAALAAREADPQAPAPEAPQAHHVPITAMLDEREKRQKAESQAEDLKRQLHAFQQRQEAQPIPDKYEDPEGYEAYQQAQIQSAMYAQNLQWSRRIAEIQHTPEVVAQAFDWGVQKCNEDPFFNERVRSSPDPYGVVLQEWKRDQVASTVDLSEYQQFQAWKAAQAQASGTLAAAAPAAPSQSPTPPRSQAALPSAGGGKPGETPVHAGASYGSIFG